MPIFRACGPNLSWGKEALVVLSERRVIELV